MIYIFFILFVSAASSQQYVFDYSFGNFENASSFHINSMGLIYVTDSGKDNAAKFDTLGAKLKDIGGYGWDEGAFYEPVDVFATPLNIYISDKNNHRIQRFDKDLNFISQLSTRESEDEAAQFGYPVSSVTSNLGDLFVLDSENKRIIKFDLFGNFIMNFGGFDWGDYALSDPKKMAVSPSNNIYVIDGNDIVVFDQYGNGISRLNPAKDFKDIKIVYSNLVLNTDSEIFYSDLKSEIKELEELYLMGMEKFPKIISCFIFNKKVYLLSPFEILVFKSIPANDK